MFKDGLMAKRLNQRVKIDKRLVSFAILYDQQSSKSKNQQLQMAMVDHQLKLLDKQINSINKKYAKNEIVICVGYQSHIVINHLHKNHNGKNIRIVENPNYLDSNSCESLRIIMNNIHNNRIIIIDGSIDAKGGAGGSGLGSGNSSQRGGGGGSGGSIRLLASVISGSGALSVYRGIGSNGGGSGSDGRIRLEAFDHNFTVGTNPGYTYSSPSVVFLPTNNIVPSVRVVSVDGQLVPANPTGSFGPADLDITNAAPVTLDIVTENIPTGATVTVTMWSENGGSTNFTSSPLMGTDQSSTGTVPVPFGFSRFYIDAYWAN